MGAARRQRQRSPQGEAHEPPLGVEQVDQREQVVLVGAPAVQQHQRARRGSPAGGRTRWARESSAATGRTLGQGHGGRVAMGAPHLADRACQPAHALVQLAGSSSGNDSRRLVCECRPTVTAPPGVNVTVPRRLGVEVAPSSGPLERDPDVVAAARRVRPVLAAQVPPSASISASRRSG